VIKSIRLNYMVRRPFSACRYPECYKPAIAIIRDLSVTKTEYILCSEHVEELMKRMEEVEVEIDLEIYVYTRVSTDELGKMGTLLKHYPNLKR